MGFLNSAPFPRYSHFTTCRHGRFILLGMFAFGLSLIRKCILYWACIIYVTWLLVVVRTIVEKLLLLKILSKNASPPLNLGFCKPCLYQFSVNLLGINILPQNIIKIKYHSKPKIIDLYLLLFLNKENTFYPCIIQPSWHRDPILASHLARDQYITSK